jgi:hypothetical protein
MALGYLSKREEERPPFRDRELPDLGNFRLGVGNAPAFLDEMRSQWQPCLARSAMNLG